MSLRIFIVDDDPLFTEMLPRLLKRRVAAPDMVFRTARSPMEAREVLARETFDVLLSDFDLKTPETGIDVLQHAARVSPDTLRILISGHMPHEIPDLESPPFQAFVAKPMTLREMLTPLLSAITRGRGIVFQAAPPT